MFNRKPKLIRYPTESVEAILKHVRTHIAGQADQLSTVGTLVTGIDQRMRDDQAVREQLGEQLDEIQRSLSSIRDSLAVCARETLKAAQDGGPASEAA